MRILIHGLNFAPELVGVGKYTGEMAEWLAARGHQVRAVTAPPFNPEWRVARGFSPWRYSREDSIGGSRSGAQFRELAVRGHLTVLRCPLWVPLRPAAATRSQIVGIVAVLKGGLAEARRVEVVVPVDLCSVHVQPIREGLGHDGGEVAVEGGVFASQGAEDGDGLLGVVADG